MGFVENDSVRDLLGFKRKVTSVEYNSSDYPVDCYLLIIFP